MDLRVGLPARKVDVLSSCGFIFQIEHHKTKGDLGDASSHMRIIEVMQCRYLNIGISRPLW